MGISYEKEVVANNRNKFPTRVFTIWQRCLFAWTCSASVLSMFITCSNTFILLRGEAVEKSVNFFSNFFTSEWAQGEGKRLFNLDCATFLLALLLVLITHTFGYLRCGHHREAWRNVGSFFMTQFFLTKRNFYKTWNFLCCHIPSVYLLILVKKDTWSYGLCKVLETSARRYWFTS